MVNDNLQQAMEEVIEPIKPDSINNLDIEIVQDKVVSGETETRAILETDAETEITDQIHSH